MKKKILAVVIVLVFSIISIYALGSKEEKGDGVYLVGICNYVDDASLNQICSSITDTLSSIEKEQGVKIDVLYENANADSNILTQIVASFISDDVDLMIAVATPVALVMQNMTEDNGLPVVFAAVSDPVGAGLVDSLSIPGSNITGTSDYLDTKALISLMTALNPSIKKVGLLYDVGQDSSTAAIKSAKEILTSRGVEIVEKSGTTIDEIVLAADSLISSGVEAVFTPSDNTVMTAELSIYEKFIESGIPHYAGADSFALNGAFLGYGVDYVKLGQETAQMVADILLFGKDPSSLAVRTFDNGTATVNREALSAFGYTEKEIETILSPYCTAVKFIDTAESF